MWGVVMVLSGDTDTGRRHLTRSAEIDESGYARAENIAGIAGFLGETGNTPAARALLEIGAELHPEDEEINSALAELREGE